MTLTGNLEDLPLLDILQIASFSRTTGQLAIHTSSGEAAIVFREGQVVSCFTWDSPPMDARARTLPDETRFALIRNRIELGLEQLIRLREGEFSFALAESSPAVVAGRDISEESLAAGLNVQQLLIELTRGMDEDRRDSKAALEASFGRPGEAPPAIAQEGTETAAGAPPAAPVAEPSVAEPAEAPAEARVRTVLLVDDEEQVRGALARRLTRGGYEVVEAGDPGSAVKHAHRLGKEGTPFLLVTDLGMPSSGGASFQGGFEVVKRLWKMNLRPPVVMMTESLGPSLRARARQMKVQSVVFKPGLSKLDPEQFQADLEVFAGKVVSEVLPRIGGLPPGPPSGEAPPPPPAPPPSVTAPSPPAAAPKTVSLEGRLQELRHGDAIQISLLIMKAAREAFERGILFLVREQEARGLGGFGQVAGNEDINVLVRDVAISLLEPSMFRFVVQGQRPFKGPLPGGKWEEYLMSKIGAFQSEDVALLPLLAHHQAIALLYGDNPDTGREVGPLESLEGFIGQAGIALETALRQRKPGGR